ncbi:hypothetical protein Haur_1371 [Herpetosiphon aurantiacus DSM 785]|uniref:Uncharacterized protein n=1 Tax=Herpetosiphon aurantiacus (strain ATCC 23779 / DSM 785 / 114-95) TaxID=316274 RepID=A9B2H1_HERA2|nr:hypothetical protein Haur_1371 [Herpetosiphon aurantiacus DSM 785]
MAVMLSLTIGGEVKEIRKLPFRQNQDFKKKLIDVAKKVMPQVDQMSKPPATNEAGTQSGEALTAYIVAMLESIDGLLEEAFKLIIAYASGTLSHELDQEILDDEIIDAFLCIANAAVPIKKLQVLAAGFSSIG